ncbi:MAG TPA: XRE family transcriptional regulator [Pirellulales bacterium]|nr:XRE family transcriptional regulator [Pirellulales bacterium]
MAFEKVEIGRRIRSVREELGVSVQDLAAACGAAESTITRLETGTLDPVPGDYILIAARLLKTDFRYFISDVLDDVERETRRLFRAMDEPRPADLRALRRFMLFCMAEHEMEILLNAISPALPPEYPRPGRVEKLAKDQGKQAACDERERMGISINPISNIFTVLRQHNVRLFRQPLEDARLSGVTIAHPKAGVCVLVKYDEDLYRQFFSAAHEYAHVLFDRGEINSQGCIVSYRFSTNALIEMRANAFAAEFLLPTDALPRYPKPKTLDDLKDSIDTIARDYRVNTETVAIRMKERGWISDKTLSSFQKTKPVVIRRHEKSDPDIPQSLTPAQAARFEAAIRHGISSRLWELLRRGLTENVITFGRFAEMLDLTVEEAREFIRSTGMAV